MQRKLLLEHIDVPGIQTYDVYRSKGGYASVEKALKTMTPDAVTEEVKKSGLRGRGGAGRVNYRVGEDIGSGLTMRQRIGIAVGIVKLICPAAIAVEHKRAESA